MAVPKKTQKQILDAVATVAMEMYDQHYPAHKEGPPDSWPEHERKLWDLIGEMEYRAAAKLKVLFAPPP
jgi:hypothetical protein